MKKMKKLVGFMLAAMMLFSMSAVVFAATVPVTVTVDPKLEGHTFEAYQIFKGTQTETEKQLVDVTWGDGINSAAFLTALKAETSFGNRFADCESPADVAEALDHLADDSAVAKKFAELAYANKSATKTTISGGTATLDSGYYLIVDTTDLSGKDDANNAALLQVTADITIAYKTDKPSVEKKVLENDKYNNDGAYGVGYNDVADYCINEVVTYHLIGKVPDMSEYDTYEYWFVDEMDDALTLKPETINVYLSDDKKVDIATEGNTGDARIDESYYSNTDKATTEGFDIYFENLKSVPDIAKDKYIIVEYQATLNADAEIGLPGQLNGVYLKYTNNPDQGGLGQTEKDYVIVFTYELDVTKVDGDTQAGLGGAKFVLYRGEGANKEYVQINADNKVTGWTANKDQAEEFVTVANVPFEVIGLDHGTYYLEETDAPAGYNLIKEPIKLVINATTSNGQTWEDKVAANALTALKLDVTVNEETTTANGVVDTGIVATEVENYTGTTLPETGGMGTMLFYVAGSVLVIGAVIILVTKKRMR